MIGYVKCFDSNKTMSFKVIENKLLKKYTKIQERVSSFMNIEFDSGPVCGDNEIYINTLLHTTFRPFTFYTIKQTFKVAKIEKPL